MSLKLSDVSKAFGEDCAKEAAVSRTPEEVERIRQRSSQLGDRPTTIGKNTYQT